jgi:transketolase
MRQPLAKTGVHAAVVSMPSFELFRRQPAAYREDVLGAAPRIAIEAAVEQCWRWLRHKDTFIGMSSFGASAPARSSMSTSASAAKAAAAARDDGNRKSDRQSGGVMKRCDGPSRRDDDVWN